jgi:hypothetical protein
VAFAGSARTFENDQHAGVLGDVDKLRDLLVGELPVQLLGGLPLLELLDLLVLVFGIVDVLLLLLVLVLLEVLVVDGQPGGEGGEPGIRSRTAAQKGVETLLAYLVNR